MTTPKFINSLSLSYSFIKVSVYLPSTLPPKDPEVSAFGYSRTGRVFGRFISKTGRPDDFTRVDDILRRGTRDSLVDKKQTETKRRLRYFSDPTFYWMRPGSFLYSLQLTRRLWKGRRVGFVDRDGRGGGGEEERSHFDLKG